MKHLVEFPLEEGGSIVVEIDEPETGGTVRILTHNLGYVLLHSPLAVKHPL